MFSKSIPLPSKVADTEEDTQVDSNPSSPIPKPSMDGLNDAERAAQMSCCFYKSRLFWNWMYYMLCCPRCYLWTLFLCNCRKCKQNNTWQTKQLEASKEMKGLFRAHDPSRWMQAQRRTEKYARTSNNMDKFVTTGHGEVRGRRVSTTVTAMSAGNPSAQMAVILKTPREGVEEGVTEL